jgi:hypothetical protein
MLIPQWKDQSEVNIICPETGKVEEKIICFFLKIIKAGQTKLV